MGSAVKCKHPVMPVDPYLHGRSKSRKLEDERLISPGYTWLERLFARVGWTHPYLWLFSVRVAMAWWLSDESSDCYSSDSISSTWKRVLATNVPS